MSKINEHMNLLREAAVCGWRAVERIRESNELANSPDADMRLRRAGEARTMAIFSAYDAAQLAFQARPELRQIGAPDAN